MSNQDNRAVFIKGDKRNPAVIFIHGFPFDHSMWSNQMDKLAGGYFCITYDIRGLGESSAVDGQYTMETLVDDLFSLIKETNLEKPVLCGLSMGGYIAQRAVERSESTFGALILCDTKSGADDNETKLKRAAGIKSINEQGTENYIRSFIPNCFAEESIIRLGNVYKEILEKSSKFSSTGIKACLLAMAGRTDTTAFLSRIKIPVLLICGEKDKISPPPVMEQMSGLIADSEFHIIPGAGHITPVENPEYFNEVINDFLRRRIKQR